MYIVILIFVLTEPRPPLIMQSPPLDVPQVASPDLLLNNAESKKKQRERIKEENENMDKNVFYDIVSSPSKDSARLTLKLSRVKITGHSEELLQTSPMDSDHDTVVLNNDLQSSASPQDFSHKSEVEEQANCQQDTAQPNTKETGVIGGIVFDDSEIDALAEIERIESANERERCSKEVQDKGEICGFMPDYVLTFFEHMYRLTFFTFSHVKTTKCYIFY